VYLKGYAPGAFGYACGEHVLVQIYLAQGHFSDIYDSARDQSGKKNQAA
jgi:hypothetical protein